MKKSLQKYPNNIKKYRKKIGLSLKELAKRVNIKNESTIKNWEEGKYLPRSGMSLVLLLIAFNTTANKLYPDYMRKIRREMNNRVAELKKLRELPSTFRLK